jgi:hypothetical protein
MKAIIKQKYKDDIIMPTFIDDITLGVTAQTWEEVVEKTETIMKGMYEWVEKKDVKFAEDKL